MLSISRTNGWRICAHAQLNAHIAHLFVQLRYNIQLHGKLSTSRHNGAIFGKIQKEKRPVKRPLSAILESPSKVRKNVPLSRMWDVFTGKYPAVQSYICVKTRSTASMK